MNKTTILARSTFSLTAALSIVCLSATLIDTHAQRRGPHRRRGGFAPAPAKRQIFDFKVLGPLRDKFAAYKRLTFGGAGYYTKQNARLREAHAKTYMLIRNSLVADRINEELGRKATSDLLSIGEEAKRLRGGDKALSEKDAGKIGHKILTLAKRLKEARLNKVKTDTLTPKLNEHQMTMEEILRFAIDTKLASKGQAATMRRHIADLEKKEEHAKNDNKITDRERKKLAAETIDVWKVFVRILKP